MRPVAVLSGTAPRVVEFLEVPTMLELARTCRAVDRAVRASAVRFRVRVGHNSDIFARFDDPAELDSSSGSPSDRLTRLVARWPQVGDLVLHNAATVALAESAAEAPRGASAEGAGSERGPCSAGLGTPVHDWLAARPVVEH